MATCRTCAYLRKCIEKATKEGYEHNVDFDASSGCTNFGFKSNTNADRIRAMSDEELARFLADKIENEYILSCKRIGYEKHMLTATEIEAIRHTVYCAWKQWLKQPVEDKNEN